MKLLTAPPSGWSQISDFFNSPEWHTVLEEGFGCRSFYFTDPEEMRGISANIFTIGPFRIAYIAFPVSIDCPTALIAKSSEIPFPVRIDELRITLRDPSSFDMEGLTGVVLPETVISNLQEWCVESLPGSLRRNLRKAKAYGLEIADATEEGQAEILFDLYHQTVIRHGGSVRYNLSYFQALVRLSLKDKRLRVMLARHGEDAVGFLTAAISNDTAYYLHGASRATAMHLRPSDLLFSEAISWARAEGANAFNMLASPAHQPGLVRYKEKWGGRTSDQLNVRIPIHRFNARLLNFSEKLYRLIL